MIRRTRLNRLLRLVAHGLVVLIMAGGISLAVSTVTAPAASADPAPSVWLRLRICESGNNYGIVSATGTHYGAYQFDLSTWKSVGGTGLPNQASPAEQDYRALYLYRMRGWQSWTCARILNLQPDGDAASGRIPVQTPPPAQPVQPVSAPMPAWPGLVYAYGDCAPALRTWQLRMNSYGYHFQGTGCYEDKTKAAVLAVQHANGINPSGRLGPKTWRAAWEGKPPAL